jgi:hypothetical protein
MTKAERLILENQATIMSILAVFSYSLLGEGTLFHEMNKFALDKQVNKTRDFLMSVKRESEGNDGQ